MRTFLCAIFLLLSSFAISQTVEEEVKKFQEELNTEFKDPEKSPLAPEVLKKFRGHEFFPINPDYQIVARFSRNKKPVPFKMKTSTDRRPIYVKYGTAEFELNGKTYQLGIYQNEDLSKKEEYKNYLFLPFTDLTNGFETYGGGRYIDLSIPTGDTIVIDFNKAYNPFCAYSHDYSCPVPPKENRLNTRIEAGVKALD